MRAAPERLRLAIVRQRYDPAGGAERFIERTVPALDRAGIEVTLIARRWGDAGGGHRRVLAVDPAHAGNLWRDWSFARAARRAWLSGGFDLVQSHERIAGCDLYRAGDGVHAAWLQIRRASAGPLERIGMAISPFHRYICAAERRMFRHPALRAVVCNSNMVREEIRRSFGVAAEKLHVIYNGVDLEEFHPRHRAALRAAARAELGVGEREVLYLFVGSGFFRKGLDAAIGALARCTEEPWQLVAAGRDRDAARFAAMAQASGVGARLRLVGAREDLRPLYAAADCFILPTRYDPFPNTALEAMAMGLPVVVGRRSGAAEVLRHGESGWVCDPEDVPGLAQLMRAAAAAGDGQVGMAARAVAENFAIDDMARKLAQLYAALK